MGIKQLNNYLVTTCSTEAIKKIGLEELRGKRVVVDASIYLYRFMADGRLTEHMYQMIATMLHYGIEPVFIFDGDSPPEKKELLAERKEKKQKAETKYEELKLLMNNTANESDKMDIVGEMEKLKKQFIYIKSADYQVVKTLLNTMGVAWIEAPGEADELCAHLMLTDQAYACLSEDMDMFAYGCSKVLRHLSLVNHTVLLYDLRKILFQLGMNVQEFRQILVLAGTDYNKNNSVSLQEAIKWFCRYKNEMLMWEGVIPTFYEWLINKTNLISNADALCLTHKMFNVKNKNLVYNMVKPQADRKSLVEYLGQDGFVFVGA